MDSTNKALVRQKKSLDDLLDAGEVKTGKDVIKHLEEKAAQIEAFKKAADDELRHRRSRAK